MHKFHKNDFPALAKLLAMPAVVVLLGLILIVNPDSLSAAIGGVIGFVVSVCGAGLMLSYFFGTSRSFYRLCCGIVLMVIGFAVVRSPLLLARNLGRLIGIMLLLPSIRELTAKPDQRVEKISSLVSMVIGVILILAPMSASRLLISLCGLAVLLVGLSMGYNRLHGKYLQDAEKPDIIDAL